MKVEVTMEQERWNVGGAGGGMRWSEVEVAMERGGGGGGGGAGGGVKRMWSWRWSRRLADVETEVVRGGAG